jgi:fatty acid desaturase
MLPRAPLVASGGTSPRQVRRGGALLLAMGLVLLAIAAACMALALGGSGTFAEASADPPPPLPIGAWILLGFVAVFGAVASIEGAAQLATGRRNARRVHWLVVLGLVFIGAGVAARALA